MSVACSAIVGASMKSSTERSRSNSCRMRARRLLQEQDLPGHLERGETCGRKLAKLPFRNRTLRMQHDGRRDVLPERRIRYGKHDGLGNRRVVQQHLVYLTRRDLFSPAIDDFLQAPRDRQVAVLVDRSLIARPEPAVRERACVGFGVVLVAAHHNCAADDDLARPPGRQQMACFIHDGDLGSCGQSNRSGLPF